MEISIGYCNILNFAEEFIDNFVESFDEMKCISCEKNSLIRYSL